MHIQVLTKKNIFSASDLPRLGFGMAPRSEPAQERRPAAAPNPTTAGKVGPVPGPSLALIEPEVGLECPVEVHENLRIL